MLNTLPTSLHQLPTNPGQLIPLDPLLPQPGTSTGGFADMLRNFDAEPAPEPQVMPPSTDLPSPPVPPAPPHRATSPNVAMREVEVPSPAIDPVGKPDTDTGEPGPPCVIPDTGHASGALADPGCTLPYSVDPDGGISVAGPGTPGQRLRPMPAPTKDTAKATDVETDAKLPTDPGAAVAGQLQAQSPANGIAQEPIGTDLPPRTVPEAMARASDRAQGQQQAERQAQVQAIQAAPLDAPSAAPQSFAAALQSNLSSALPRAVGGSTAISGMGNAASLAAATAARAGDADDAPAAATVVHMPESLDDAAFASALGARLTLLAKDGVQKAELHLNPADMGPVAVQIKVDGSQAQVTFHAAQADTRGVLEQGLPDLAAALAASGLTLAGGGVFQQQSGARGGQGDSSQGGPDRGVSGVQGVDGANALPQGMPVGTRPRGVVDLYA